MSDDDATLPHEGPLSMAVPAAGAKAHPIRLDVLDAGGQVRASWSGTGRCSLGSHPSNELVIADPTVSRLHAEVIASESGVVVRDLASTNGTWLDGLRIHGAWARDGSLIALGGRDSAFDRRARCERTAHTGTEQAGLLDEIAQPKRPEM